MNDPLNDPRLTRRYFITLDGERTSCDDMRCAGMTLSASITSGGFVFGGTVVYSGISGAIFEEMTKDEISLARVGSNGQFGHAFVCEHEMHEALTALNEGQKR